MDGTTIVTSVLTLIAGVGVFLIACTMMSSNLESLGSKKLKSLFSKTAKSKLVGIGVGTVTTAVIQSSSATSVMVIGFVNAGVMTLAQAATVIFGANIGTTVTGQFVALGMFGSSRISTSVLFATFAGVGAFITVFTKKDKLQKIGGIMAGFGMIFVGLSLMSGSMKSFSEWEKVKNFLALFENPLLLVLIGAALTAVIQSSSVMTSMAIAMVVTGLISLNQGIYITMGSNIGTCVTALIAGISSNRNAKRTALIHLIFNISGVIVFMLVGFFMGLGGIDYGYLFAKVFPGAPQTQLAMFHTVFNLTTVLIVLPLTDLLVRAVTKMIPDKKEKPDKDAPRLYYVDEHLLITPPLAVQQVKNEILHMAEISAENFSRSVDMICTLDFAKLDAFQKNENELNFLNKELGAFIAKLLKTQLSDGDRVYLTTAIRTVSDLERVGDYAENITEYADKLQAANNKFSENAIQEIVELRTLVLALYEKVRLAYGELSIAALHEALAIEERIDAVTAAMANRHITRLCEGVCTPDAGARYLSLSSDTERIADHFVNVANTIKEYA